MRNESAGSSATGNTQSMRNESAGSSATGHYIPSEDQSEPAPSFADISAVRELRLQLAYENDSCCTRGDIGSINELASSSSSGINLFLSVQDAEHFVPRVQQRGPIAEVTFQPGDLGMQVNSRRCLIGQCFKSVVTRVAQGGQAACLGVQVGWEILQIDDTVLGPSRKGCQYRKKRNKALAKSSPFAIKFDTSFADAIRKLMEEVGPDVHTS